ncbi:MAG: biotin/lipoyl-containing protein, partial [Chthoniobacterales bacterium]
MSIEVKVPSVGESITSGVLSIWHKKDGESVSPGDVLYTLETDKVSTEVQANDAGVLKVAVQEGDEVKVGQIIATLEEGKGAAPEAKPKKEAEKAASAKEEKSEAALKKAEPAPEAPKAVALAPAAAPRPEGRTTRKKLSPLRRKIATQLVSAQQTAAILTTFNECDMSTVMQFRK